MTNVLPFGAYTLIMSIDQEQELTLPIVSAFIEQGNLLREALLRSTPGQSFTIESTVKVQKSTGNKPVTTVTIQIFKDDPADGRND